VSTHQEFLAWLRKVKPFDVLLWVIVLTLSVVMISSAIAVIAELWQRS
jgi:hypothetical protein